MMSYNSLLTRTAGTKIIPNFAYVNNFRLIYSNYIYWKFKQ